MARLINYLFSFLIVKVVTTAEYGDYTKFYAFAGFILVVLTHGMETAYFRFRTKNGVNPQAFSTAYTSMAAFAVFFLLLSYLFAPSIASLAKVEAHPEYVTMFAWIMALDTLVALPFAGLRAQNKALKFALFRIVNICLFIFFILLFLFWMPNWNENSGGITSQLLQFYDPEFGIGYVFLSNMLASIVTFFLLIKELRQLKFGFNFSLYKEMLPYALPIMLVGFAGMINEMLSRVMMEYLLPFDAQTNKEQLGIFGFNYKFAMLISLFLQAYRYAAEPYFFSQASSDNAKSIYARSMHYFIIAGSFIFLGVMVFLPIIQQLLLAFDPKYANYFVGDGVVPILLAANLILGIYFNLTTWYKVTDKTHIGAIISTFGATTTFLLNLWWIPRYGYMGAAWSTFCCYLLMVIAGYIAEQKYYPIHYQYKSALLYLLMAIGFWQIHSRVITYFEPSIFLTSGFSLLFLLIFLMVSYLREIRKPKSLI